MDVKEESAKESVKTRRARAKLERRLKYSEGLAAGEPELERQKEQIGKWLERHETDRVTLQDLEPAEPGDEIEAFLDQLKKRDLGL